MPGLLPKLLRGGFDVVQVFPSLNHNALLAFLATRLTRTPMVFCSFDFLDYASLIRERGGRMDVNVIASHVPSRREAYMLKRVEHVFAISQRELAFFRRFNSHASYSPVPVLVDEYLVPSASPRDRHGIGSDEFVFLCLGRVSEIKGQDLALEAFIRIQRDVPGSRLVIVGRSDYEQEFVASMKHRIEDFLKEIAALPYEVRRNIEPIGWVSGTDKTEALRNALFAVFPSRHEVQPIAVLEVLAYGKPAVVSDIPEFGFVVESGAGMSFERGDSASLAQSMKRMLACKERRDMGEKGRAWVKDLTWDTIANEFERFLCKVAIERQDI